ncbi:Spore germination protein A1 [compost metagenome]
MKRNQFIGRSRRQSQDERNKSESENSSHTDMGGEMARNQDNASSQSSASYQQDAGVQNHAGSQQAGTQQTGSQGASSSQNAQLTGNKVISGDLQQTVQRIQQETGDSADIVIRKMSVNGQKSVPMVVIYLNGLSDPMMINSFVMESITGMEQEEAKDSETLLDQMKSHFLSLGEANIVSEWNDVILAILSGDTAIFLEGSTRAIVAGTRGGEWRSITESTNELVVRGPKDSFVESIATNISLIRRRIRNTNLWLETMKIGEVTHTHVAMMYIKSMADPKLIQEVRERLANIQLNGVLESGYIEEFIQDKTFTLFPTIYSTERPDTAAGHLLEGRVVIIVDGTPFVLILPTVFGHFFQSPEDYAQRFDISILMRMIRYLSFIVLVLGPSLYIALTTFHYEMIPSLLLTSLLAQREGVPFPAFVEALLMEVTFELLREAGLRMPRAIGQTISIVGALILGQAVVEAGLITPGMVIVVALTGIASFAPPSYSIAVAGRLIRFLFMVLAGMFGLYGITLGILMLVVHMNSLRSFGVPYLAPIAPFVPKDQKDSLLRMPAWILRTPPSKIKEQHQIREGRNKDSIGANQQQGQQNQQAQQGRQGQQDQQSQQDQQGVSDHGI